MLPPPPCISFLIGCHEGDYVPSGGSSGGGSQISGGNGNAGVDIPHWNGYSPSTSGGTSGGSSGGTSGASGSTGGSNGSSGNQTGFSSSSFSSSSRAGLNFGGLTSPGSIFGSPKDSFAYYALALKNTSANPLKGLSVTHGPVPFGAVFDPSRSSQGCSQVNKSVICTTDLNPSESKTLTVAYKVANTLHCRLTPILQSVKTAFSSPSQGASTPPVTTSVSCNVLLGNQSPKTVATAGGSSSTGALAPTNASSGANGKTGAAGASSSAQTTGKSGTSAGGAAAKKVVAGTNGTNGSGAKNTGNTAKGTTSVGGTNGAQTYAGAGFGGGNGAFSNGSSNGDAMSSGYAQGTAGQNNGHVKLPRTGASELFFASTTQSDYVLVKKSEPVGSLHIVPIFLLSFASITIVFILLKGRFRPFSA